MGPGSPLFGLGRDDQHAHGKRADEGTIAQNRNGFQQRISVSF